MRIQDEDGAGFYSRRHHASIGVGGLVFRNDEVLLVNDMVKGKWAVPGGLVEPSESLEEAVQREVLEETSVRTKPLGVCALRYLSRPANKGGDDLYVVFIAEWVANEPRADGKEVSDAIFLKITIALSWERVDLLSRSLIEEALKSRQPLLRAMDFVPAEPTQFTIYTLYKRTE